MELRQSRDGSQGTGRARAVPSVLSERVGQGPSYGQVVHVPQQILNDVDDAGPIVSPVLWFDMGRIAKNVDRLRSSSERHNIVIAGAVKAIANTGMLRRLAYELDGFEISNMNEYEMIPKLNYRCVIVNAPGGFVPLISEDACETLYVVGSMDQAEHCPPRRAVLIRLNTSELLSARSIGHEGRGRSRFGLARREVERAINKIHKLGHAVRGVHFHMGHEGVTVEDFLHCVTESCSLMRSAGVDMEVLDIGGGLHAVREEIGRLFHGVRNIVGRDTVTITEPGRELFTGAGFATTRVLSMARRGGATECTVDLSAECHLRWSRPFLCARLDSVDEPRETVVFGGPTCAESDRIGVFRTPVSVGCKAGDALVFGGINGYSASWNAGFNGISAARMYVL